MTRQPAGLRSRPSWRGMAGSTLLLLLALLLVAGCGRRSQPAPTPMPDPTAISVAPTATPSNADDSVDPAARTVVPPDYRPVVDPVRAYRLALPPGWTQVDLRGEQFRAMVRRAGMEAQLQPLFDFLATPAGEAIGVVAATDLSGMLFGALPTVLNVSVVDADNMTTEDAASYLTGWLDRVGGGQDALTLEQVTAGTVNGLPAVEVEAVADLANYGLDAPLYIRAVGLLAADRIYLLTLATTVDRRADRADTFSAIIGSFGPLADAE